METQGQVGIGRIGPIARDRVSEAGPLPLDLLEVRIDSWMAAVKKSDEGYQCRFLWLIPPHSGDLAK